MLKRKWIAINVLPLIAVAGLFLSGGANGQSGNAVPAIEEDIFHHAVRLTGVIEVYGERVEIDAVVGCEGYAPESSQGRARGILIPMVRRLVFPIDGGEVYIVPTGNWCKHGDMSAGSAEASFALFEPVDGWVPMMTIRERTNEDDYANGVPFGRYIVLTSETAVFDPSGPIRIIEPFVQDVMAFPPTPELKAKAEEARQYHAELQHQSSELYNGFSGLPSLIIIPEEVWRDPLAHIKPGQRVRPNRIKPEILVNFIDGLDLPPDSILSLGNLNRGLLDGEFQTVRAMFQQTDDNSEDASHYGIPQKNLERFGLNTSPESAARLADQRVPQLLWSDRLIPLGCTGANSAQPLFDQPGRAMGYSYPYCGGLHREVFLDVPGRTILGTSDIRESNFFLDTATMELWYLR